MVEDQASQPVHYPFSGVEYDQIATGTDDLAFWADTIRGAGSVLELGVGSGRLAVALCSLCVEYHAIDQEPSMLAVAQRKVAAAGGSATLHQGNFIDLNLSKRFDAVLLPANTVSHVVTDDEAGRFFRGVRRHLAQDGLFAIDTFNPRPRPRRQRYEFNRYLDPEDDVEVVVFTTPAFERGVVTHNLDHMKAGQCVRRSLLRQRIYSRAELAEWLGSTGFENVEFYGDYQLGPLDAQSSRLIVKAS